MIAEYPFTSNYFTIDRHRLHYIDEGEGPVVVLIHGNPTWSYYYRNLIQKLRSGHRVIAIDHLGCGLSDKPQDYPYTLHQHIENLYALLEHLEIDRYSMVVHDWGGAIGMGCAVRSPKKLERVVILNTAAYRSTRIPARIRICRWPFIGPLIVRGFNGFAWPATFMAVKKPLSPKVKRAYLMPYDNWKNRVAVSAFVKDIPLSASHPTYKTLTEVEHGLQGLADRNVPVLILWGGKDFCFTKHFYDEWCRRFPGAETHFFENGGHYILEDHFDEIAPLVEKFLEVQPNHD